MSIDERTISRNKLTYSSEPFKGKTVVNFGDSIFGNTQDSTSVSSYIANKTGATVHNLGFGGCRMSKHSTPWDAFSMYSLADTIVTNDYTKQDTALMNGADTLPHYFDNTVELMKTIDFNTVDYITIAYGTNDYTAGVNLDNEADLLDVNTYKGALRYSLEKIMTTYPHLKIMALTPTYRFWRDDFGEFVEDSGTKLFNGTTLDAFVTAIIEVSKEYKTPYLDNYYDLGINKFNRDKYFPSNDSTHPNATGNEKLGSKIASQLISRF
jgi:lysophospholipase L1-like esterase